jgi:FMNH2-dependent dimethyl sulfone monooxygenase
MRLGIWTPLPHTIRAEPAREAGARQVTTRGGEGLPDESSRFAVDVVRKAEGFGFETTLIAERLLGPELEAWIQSTALATHTTSIEIMPAIHPGIVTPQVVAKMGASLDRISGGRFAINIVNGWFQQEFELFSNGAWLDASDARYRRMDEFVRVVAGLWTEDDFSLDGEFYKVKNATLPMKPVRRPHPPIYTASRADSGKDVIARYCDVWFVLYAPDYRAFETSFAAIRQDIATLSAHAREFGRTLRFGMNAHVVCADTMEEAHARAEDLEQYGKRDRIASTAARALGAGLVGTPELIAERMLRYEAIGLDLFLMHFHPMMEGLDNFAAKVMPLLGLGHTQPGKTENARGDKAYAAR